MSAQQASQSSTSQTSSGGEQKGQQALTRRSGGRSGLPSLLTDPLDMFTNPFSLIRRMQDEVNRVFQSGYGGSPGRQDDLTNVVWAPPVEVNYKDGKLQVSVELPGIRDADVNVEINNDVLVIRGERKEEREENERGMRRTEIRYGQFYRAIPLPDGANPEQATAEFRNGVLQVNIPVAQNVRQIPVQTGTGSQQGAESATGRKEPATEKAA